MYIPLRAALILGACLSSVAQAQSQPLTLDDALRRALAVTPQTASATARVEALSATRTAAGLRPPPSIDVTAENFGPPSRDLYDQFQVTGSYSQRIERGGKREARVTVVDRNIDLARAQALVARLDIIAAVQRGYVEVQATQAALEPARQRLAVAEALERNVRRRVASARDPVFAGTRARTAMAQAKVDLALAEHASEAALRRLTAYWGDAPERWTVSAETFLDFAPPAGPVRPSGADLAVAEAKGRRAGAAIDLERANAVRDPTLSAGPRYLRTGNLGFVAGVSIPIGGRRLAQARISEAEAERRRADADLAFERFNRERDIMLAEEKVEEARHEAEATRDEILPVADRTLTEVRFGYSRGFFSFADVSVAQSALTDARARMIDAARRYHEARVDLDRLTGRFTRIAEEAR
ncbi:MAG: TolC family protein [Pseudomonadota bacterium]